ncbi:hypothetical protein PY254_10635 [Rhodanobacter sp. AS-Z3]|jgi:hypothetical protein|nr:hypothetical protein [Rhodanobacter sp. AS-Z3]WEN13702.1 hypothetical protein PY254_10635 [Rhodanobacter sp. AS-Z3]
MLYYRAAKRLARSKRQQALVDGTTAQAGGTAAQELFKQLGNSPE